MMKPILGMIHTVEAVVGSLHGLCKEIDPDVAILDIVDSALLQHVLDIGRVTPLAYRRLCDDVVFITECGAQVVLVTCSSLSPCVDAARHLVAVPVLKIDEPMAEQAVKIGTRIGVIATVPTTLTATANLLQQQAQIQHRKVSISAVLCDGAYDRLVSGDLCGHDQIVLDRLRSLIPAVDAVVLAQASMARVAEQLDEAERVVPLLSSPRLGLQRAIQVLHEQASHLPSRRRTTASSA